MFHHKQSWIFFRLFFNRSDLMYTYVCIPSPCVFYTIYEGSPEQVLIGGLFHLAMFERKQCMMMGRCLPYPLPCHLRDLFQRVDRVCRKPFFLHQWSPLYKLLGSIQLCCLKTTGVSEASTISILKSVHFKKPVS